MASRSSGPRSTRIPRAAVGSTSSQRFEPRLTPAWTSSTLSELVLERFSKTISAYHLGDKKAVTMSHYTTGSTRLQSSS